MIKITCEDGLVVHKIYEFLSMSFPSYLGENSIYVEVDLKAGKIKINSCDFNKVIYLEDESENSINNIKVSIYKTLSEYMDYSSWGILTGVRPVKLTRKLLNLNSYKDTENILINKYLLSKEKAELSLKIAETENKILESLNDESYSIYVHIPFCSSICSYCSFNSMLIDNDRIKNYVNELVSEIEKESKYLKRNPTSIYIGGGTPTSIPIKELDKVLKVLNKNFNIPREFTVECGRSDSIDFEKLNLLKSYGVNRISINPQTINIKSSALINRPIDIKDIEDKYELANKLGFESINMDLILGLPGEDCEDMKKSIKYIESLKPENITIHNLSLKKGSKLYENEYNFGIKINDAVNFSKSYLEKRNYYPYYLYRQKHIIGNGENIGYTRCGHESIYNIVMIEEFHDIIGFGMGASTKFVRNGKINQIINFKNMKDYLSRNSEIFNKKLEFYNEVRNVT
ncbi:coproporphyrinogen dehydrogenase HemZ [Peptoniphilus catoniae]|uniref:coproporphyrinogen dehydrogenase HemZ n=1 Tax=Peptoniphilus catoniae TaxID=1660341 RepID=UPI0010FE01A3|nr:coproporphyrinogen dehydrogenase HemZ [Peptoniphilus catoniae]